MQRVYTSPQVGLRDVESYGLTIESLRRQRENLSNSLPAEHDTVVFFGVEHTSTVHKYYTCCRFVVALVYFGIFLFISQLVGNLYVNYTIINVITTLKIPLTWILFLR